MGISLSIRRHGVQPLGPIDLPAAHAIDPGDLSEADEGQADPHPDLAPQQHNPGPPVQNAALQGIVAGMAPVGGEGEEAGQADGVDNMLLRRLIVRGELQAVQDCLDQLAGDDGDRLAEILEEGDPHNIPPLHLALIPGPADPQGELLGQLLDRIPDEHVVRLLGLRNGLGSNVLQSAVQLHRPEALALCLDRIPDAGLADALAEPVFPPPGADHLLASGTLLHHALRHDVNGDAAHALSSRFDGWPDDPAQDVFRHLDAEGRTSVRMAPRRGSSSTLRAIMARIDRLPDGGASAILGRRDDEGRTPLHLAAQGGNEPALQTMIAGNNDRAEIVDERRRTPMHAAAQAGQTHAVEFLLKGDQARGDARDIAGRTPVFLASAEGHAETVAALLRGRPDRALVQENGFLGMEVMFPIVIGAAPNEASDGNSALHAAADGGHAGVVKVLLDARPDCVRLQNTFGKVALHRAAEAGHADVFELLLDAEPNTINTRDVGGNTVLHRAAMSGRANIVELILDARARGIYHQNINDHENVTGATALHNAAASGHAAIVRLILDVDAGGIHHQDRYGFTPLDRAMTEGHDDVVEILQHHQPA